MAHLQMFGLVDITDMDTLQPSKSLVIWTSARPHSMLDFYAKSNPLRSLVTRV